MQDAAPSSSLSVQRSPALTVCLNLRGLQVTFWKATTALSSTAWHRVSRSTALLPVFLTLMLSVMRANWEFKLICIREHARVVSGTHYCIREGA